MKEEKYTPEVGSWLKGREVPAPDSQQTARQVAERLPYVRQRSRWWPMPIVRRATRSSSANETDDHEPTTIPATNGHTPTVTWRTQFMLSPVKAITTGAIVFAIGGAFLIAQPFAQQERIAPAAEADTETTPASSVTGEMGWASSCTGPTIEVDGDVIRKLDHLCAPQTWTADDPRLSGQVASTWNTDTYLVDGDAKSVIANAYYLRNEHGGWACRSHLLVDGTAGADGSWESVETVMCVGEGEYDGLSAIIDFDEPVSHDGTTVQPMVGLIFPGDAPPHPAPPAAE